MRKENKNTARIKKSKKLSSKLVKSSKSSDSLNNTVAEFKGNVNGLLRRVFNLIAQFKAISLLRALLLFVYKVFRLKG